MGAYISCKLSMQVSVYQTQLVHLQLLVRISLGNRQINLETGAFGKEANIQTNTLWIYKQEPNQPKLQTFP